MILCFLDDYGLKLPNDQCKVTIDEHKIVIGQV